MNNELQEWTDDLIYKHALNFSQEELAGMYSVINKREQEYLKEIKSLRLILKSHGEVIEMNAELRKENARLREALEFYSIEEDWYFYCQCCAALEFYSIKEGWHSYCQCCADGSTKLEKDHGKRARQALKGSEE